MEKGMEGLRVLGVERKFGGFEIELDVRGGER